ncbi:hypothetical protein L6164_005187 [Bauhinia variegata]|uniref:Uncharacterized protein n=1 Tax=Bauhinia variegata TaxID=167791 RepID=A0ACB9PQF0_BAUVA|nr:hypothetical protein L6164_005187 [Bauhinia variegata]
MAEALPPFSIFPSPFRDPLSLELSTAQRPKIDLALTFSSNLLPPSALPHLSHRFPGFSLLQISLVGYAHSSHLESCIVRNSDRNGNVHKMQWEIIQKPLTTVEAMQAAKGFQRIPKCLFDSIFRVLEMYGAPPTLPRDG